MLMLMTTIMITLHTITPRRLFFVLFKQA
jgi:hypothetical protein